VVVREKGRLRTWNTNLGAAVLRAK